MLPIKSNLLSLESTTWFACLTDGLIQGAVKGFRAQCILEHITQDSDADVKQEELIVATEAPVDNALAEPARDGSKKPRKLIKDEYRESGGVKWSVCNAYRQALSCDSSFFADSRQR